MSKQMTEPECAAERWKATALLGRAVMDHRDAEIDQRIKEAETWDRFAAHPHAHEEA